MGLFNALRGGGNKDAMRQTTSLTMAYLLEQNARFEAFMRHKVETLEGIVAQQQTRRVEMEMVTSEPAEEAVEATGEVPADGELGTLSPAATQPTRPVTTLFSDFALDDLDIGPVKPIGPVISAVAGWTEPEEPVPLQDSLDLAQADNVQPINPEPGPPPAWQDLLLGGTEVAPAVKDVPEKGAAIGETAARLPAGDPDESASFLPAWLQRQQARAIPTDDGEAGPVSGSGKITCSGVTPGGEEENDWEAALANQGPVGGWE